MPKSAPKLNKTKDETTSAPTPESSDSLEQRIAELDESVEWFYSDDFSLDEAISRYESASTLAKSIEKDLAKLKNRVEIIEDFTKS